MQIKLFSTSIIVALLAATLTPTLASARERHWRGDDDRRSESRRQSRYRCRDKGNGGLAIGAVAGGLLGHEIAHDKTAGTIIGAGAGALVGRHIDRNNGRC